MIRRLRAGLERSLAARGYELRLAGTTPKGYTRFLADARRSGIEPRTVFDVGVGNGTPWLYEAFGPGTKFVLVEPQERFHSRIMRLSLTLDVDLHRCALGSEPGKDRLFVPDDTPTSASLMTWTALTADLMKKRGRSVLGSYSEVEIQTLDSINKYEAPFFIKLDVEGFEINVLRGAGRTLAETQMVIAEASILPRNQGGATLVELVSFMEKVGFSLMDFPAMEQDRAGGQLLYVDVAFVRTAP